jgi:GT2 family glycosyltransferase
MRLAVIIVNFRTSGLVIQCLESLLSQLDPRIDRTVIVDNCSQDDSTQILTDWIAAHDAGNIVQLIASKTNAGFSAGNNIGIAAVDADYYLLLNSDTILRPGAIDALLKIADANLEAGLVSPRLEWPDATPQESCFRYPSPLSELINSAQTGPISAMLKRFDVPLPVSGMVTHPQWTSFACVLVRREVIGAIGPMDEGFFMYFEDIDYCRRARNAGWDIMNSPAAHVVHLRGGSSPVKKRALERKRLPRYYYEARTRYFFLAYGWFGLTAANLLWSLGRLVSRLRELVERRGPSVPERQWLDIWTNWLRPSAPWQRMQKD